LEWFLEPELSSEELDVLFIRLRPFDPHKPLYLMEFPQIEGPARLRDLSYKFLQQYPELLELEKGIPFKEFYFHSQMRKKDIEYRVLKLITETKEHADILVRNCPLTLSLNRYPDILPYKDTVVSLASHSYINASFIDSTVKSSENMFIATQAPLKSSMNSFWSMIWECNVDLIIMICCINENGMPKCEEYFPEEGTLTCEHLEVTLDTSTQIYPYLIERHFKLTNTLTFERRYVIHLHGKNWPDQGVPKIKDEFSSIEYIIQSIKNTRLMINHSKVAVHCSAGIGRTGMLIGIFNMVIALEELIENDIQNSLNQARVSVFATTRRLREQRWGMVSNEKQFRFMYKFMEYWITNYLASQASLL
jgi:protein tyrosine phosphatase